MHAKRMMRARSAVVLAILLLAGCTQLKRFAYEGFNRDAWQKPEEVVQALRIRPGDRIADIGSGGGYFTFRLAKAVGPGGKVYAADLDEDLNEYVAERSRREAQANIEVILAEPADPRLPLSGTDLLFTSNAYHHIQDRANYFSNARKYLRPGGRVAIIEFNGKGWFERLTGHYTSIDLIEKEMRQAGYDLQQQFDFLPRQCFLVFSKSGSPG